MDTRLTVCVSTPQQKNLSDPQREFVDGLLRCIAAEGLRVNADSSPTHRLQERYEQLRRSQGVLVVALSQWKARRLYREQDKHVVMPSEFAHLANVMAVAARRPLLVLREKDVAERGSLRRAYVHPVVNLPRSVRSAWFQTQKFQTAFSTWLRRVREHRHVFLGYSSQATKTAMMVKTLLESNGLTVLDWHEDFQPGASITKHIADAEQLTKCGVFLFMADDELQRGETRLAAPRDNVVYEAGYFTGAKGQRYTLVILEKGAKVPTDLAGVIHLELDDRGDISPIESRLLAYFEALPAA